MFDDIAMVKSVLLFKHSLAYSFSVTNLLSACNVHSKVRYWHRIPFNSVSQSTDVRLIIDSTLNKILHYPDSNVLVSQCPG